MAKKDNKIATLNENSIQNVDTRKQHHGYHKLVSNMKTPQKYIEQKMGLDYVRYGYMRDLADKFYPGWSWTIISTEVLGAAYSVHGRLKWFDNGIWREGDCVAAHRIQTKKGSDEFVDVGNDLKAANTDTIKKAFNMYMNIADDIYRNQIDEYELEKNQVQQLLDTAGNVDEDTQTIIAEKIDTREINAYNFEQSLDKLKEMKK
jgi:hypothetical protein|tara:strand:- start:579 stop:1190 length:612 start_codon:yes stop_codon:yes gene_type:complete